MINPFLNWMYPMFVELFLTGINPYHHQSFFGFIGLFFQRMFSILTGNLPFDHLASDEIQVLVLIGISISSALVGCFLVLRKMTMLANALSHTILIGIVLAFVFTQGFDEERGSLPFEALFIASLCMGIITTFLTQFLTKTGKVQEDASTGLVFTTLFALGVVLVTVLTRSAHIGTEAVMGNADALHREDLYWVYVSVATNVILFLLFFKEFKLTTFDPGLAAALGFSPLFFDYLLMTQTSITTMTSFRAVGVLLVLAFMTGPVLAAKLWSHRLSSLLIFSCSIGALSALVGVAFTRHLLTSHGISLSTSGIVVCVITLFYLISSLLFFNKISFVLFLTKNNN